VGSVQFTVYSTTVWGGKLATIVG